MTKRGSAGGQAVKEKYGVEYLRELGKRGFEVTTERHFNGDRKAHLEWLRRKGAFTVDSQLSYAKPEVFPDPGPHPAHTDPQYQAYLDMLEWLRSVEAGMET